MASEREHRVLSTLADALAGAVCGFGFYLLGWLVIAYIINVGDRNVDDLRFWDWYYSWRTFLWCIGGGTLAGVLLRGRFFRWLEATILEILGR